MPGVTTEAGRLILDYTSKDFTALVAALRSHVTNRFPEITDFNAGSMVQMMIELFAAVGDRLHLTQDKQVNECNLMSARRLRNVIRHARGIGYAARSRQAAEGTIRATLNPVTAIANDVIIAADILISTGEGTPVSFRLTEPILIEAGETTNTGDIKHSVLQEQNEVSTGTANQKFLLLEPNALDDGSLVVEVDTEAWEKVDDFLDSGSTDKHYVVELDDEERITVVFGDGTNGQIPAENADLGFFYETGGGLTGNQLPNTITVNTDEFTDVMGNRVRISFTNPGSTTGGDDAETIEQIRMRAPRSLKTRERSVCEEDYAINCEDNLSGVARAKVFTADQDEDLPENHAFVHVVPVDQDAFATTSADTLADGGTSLELDTVVGLYVGNELLIDDGTTDVLVIVTSIDAEAVTIAFDAVDLGATIASGADVTRTEDGLPDPGLIADVETLLTEDKPMTLTMDLTVRGPNYLPLAVAGTVYLDPDKQTDIAQALAEAKLEDFFDFTSVDANKLYNIDWGKRVPWSVVQTLIQSTPGVTRMTNFHFIKDSVAQDVGDDVLPAFDEIVRFDPSNFGQVGGLVFTLDS